MILCENQDQVIRIMNIQHLSSPCPNLINLIRGSNFLNSASTQLTASHHFYLTSAQNWVRIQLKTESEFGLNIIIYVLFSYQKKKIPKIWFLFFVFKERSRDFHRSYQYLPFMLKMFLEQKKIFFLYNSKDKKFVHLLVHWLLHQWWA